MQPTIKRQNRQLRPGSTVINFALPDGLLARAKVAAEADMRSLSAFIRIALSEAIDRRTAHADRAGTEPAPASV